MLPTSVFIFQPAAVAGSTYTIDIFYQNPTIIAYTNLGDVIEDTAGNQYEIVSPTSLPVSDGATITVNAITNNVLPVEDADFNSSLFTPGQVDVRPEVRTSGEIGSQSLSDGPNYRYSTILAWDSSAEAAKAQAGDSVVDLNGKEFTIVNLTAGRFNDPVIIEEVVKEAVPPGLGPASLYRPTGTSKFFQGTPISDPARTVVRNRDDFNIDAEFQAIRALIASAAGTTQTIGTNSSGSVIIAGSPVKTGPGNTIELVDVSIPSDVEAIIGVAAQDIADGTSGILITDGRVENIVTSFSIGDIVWIDKSGALTNIGPNIGVNSFASGDAVVVVGTIAENLNNASQRDLIVDIDNLGLL